MTHTPGIQDVIDVGSTPNDGTGDPLRDAMIKINSNFTDLFSNSVANTSISIGNNSVNVYANSTTIITGNTTTGTGGHITNSSTVFIGNNTVNTTLNNSSLSTNSVTVQSKIQIGNAAGYNFGSLALIEIDANANSYQQIVIQNANTGNNASSDLVITADTGNDSVNFIDLGINGSNYLQSAFNIGGALDGYLYSSNSNLAIGTAANNGVISFHANGTTSSDVKMTVNATAIGIPNNVSLVIGNSTVNTVLSSTTRTVANATGTITITPASITVAANATSNIVVGNSTVNVAINSSSIAITSNTFNLGSNTNAANGYTYLPNGFKLTWGWVSANSSVGNVTFPAAYTTNVYAVTATSNSTVATYQAAVIATNNTVAVIRTANVTATNVFWHAIGY